MTNSLAIDIKNQYFTGNPSAGRFGNSPTTVFAILIPNAIIIAGTIFLFMILFAGFKIVIGAGKGQSSQDAAKAKAALTWSVVGFLLVVLSYSILDLVGAFLGINFATDFLSRI